METQAKIDISWIDEGAKQVMNLLNAQASKPAALFVGGCVRNAVIAGGATDIDIATIHTPQQTTQILERENIHVIPTGVDHGTVTAVIDGKHYEITTLRRDVETTGRHAVVAFTDDWHEDAQRRDFTMNTLLCDIGGNVYEPLGAGIDDAKSGRVIFVGDAAARIQEDYLRILRFFRFFAFYGKADADPAALSACKQYADRVDTLSKERIAQEFLKLLAASNAVAVLAMMQDARILPQVYSDAYDAQALHRLITLQEEHSAVDITARLLLLGGLKAEMLAVYADTMTLSNKFRKRYDDILSAYAMLEEGADVKIVIYRKGHYPARQALLLQTACHSTSADMTLCDTWQVPQFPVSGEDLMAAGIAQGPQIGRILRDLEDYWLQNDFAPDKSSLLARIK